MVPRPPDYANLLNNCSDGIDRLELVTQDGDGM